MGAVVQVARGEYYLAKFVLGYLLLLQERLEER